MYQDVKVNLVNVSKKMGTRMLFENLTVLVQAGQCLTITGPNGSGKSTLIKMIAGLMRVTTGTIEVFGDQRLLDAEERLASLGLVSPEIMFYGEMTGSENILFFTGARGRTCSSQEIKDYCQRVGLTAHQDQLVHTYSTGMRQRLKFALLLALKPMLWLLDEPSSNLDADGKVLVGKMIENALTEGVTVVIATNESWEAAYANYNIQLA